MATSSTVDARPLVAFYVRTGYARSVIATCEDALRRRGNDVTLAFWKAVGTAREGNTAAAIRELELQCGKRDSDLPALTALQHFHRRAKVPDADALASVEVALAAAQAKSSQSAAALVLTGTFAWLILADWLTAEDAVDRVLRENPTHEGAMTLKGWLLLTKGSRLVEASGALVTPSTPSPFRPASSDSDFDSLGAMGGAGGGALPPADEARATAASIACFEAVTAAAGAGAMPSSHIDAWLGLAAAAERKGDVSRAFDCYNAVLAAHNWFLPAAYEQARLFTKIADFESATDTVSRVLEVDPTNMECARLLTLHTLLRDGAASLKAVSRLQELLATMNKMEPRNSRLFYNVARVNARLAARSRSALSVTIAMLDTAIKLDPDVSAYHCEMGAQRLLLGDAAGAGAAYREAAKVDDTDADAVTGLIATQLAQGLVDDADAQMEMFRMISESLGGRSPALCLLDAQLAWRKAADREKALGLIGAGVKEWCAAMGVAPAAVAAAAAAAAGDGATAGASPPTSPGGSDAVSLTVSALTASPLVHIVDGAAGDGGSAADASGLTSTAALGADGLPLPLLVPGRNVVWDMYEWYYWASPETLVDLARELLLVTGATAGGADATFSSLVSAQTRSDAADRLLAPPSAARALLAVVALAKGVARASEAAESVGARVSPGTDGLALLTLATAMQPAHMPSWLTAASVYASSQQWDSATQAIQRALQLNPAFTDGHLLLAHIGLARGDARVASAALEAALAQSFGVADTPSYLRMKAAVLLSQRRYEECVATCEAAMRLPGVRRGAASGGAGGRGGAAAASSATAAAGGGVSLNDRAALHLSLAEAQLALDRVPEATKTVTDAMAEFAGSPEEANVRVASSRLALKRGDADAALALLSSIPSTSPVYPSAVSAKAEVYLSHRRDRRLYIQCFSELASRSRSEATLVALGEAYMRVQMPEEAIAAYESALSLHPSNVALACRIGRALTLMHDYRRAVTYYTSALQSADDGDSGGRVSSLSPQDKSLLRSDLTELLVKLRQFEQAQTLIQQALTESKSAIAAITAAASAGAGGAGGGDGDGAAASASADVVNLRFVRRNLVLLHRVHKGSGNLKAAEEALMQAFNVSERVLALARREPAAAAVGLALARTSGGIAAMLTPFNAGGGASVSAPVASPATAGSGSGSAAGGAGSSVAASLAATSSAVAGAMAAATMAGLGGAGAGAGAGGAAAVAAAAAPPLLASASAEELERIETASIAMQLGYFFERELAPAQDEKARHCYAEAAELCDGIAPLVPGAPTLHEACQLATARLHLRRGDVDACRIVCDSIIAVNPLCEEATVMLADLLFKQNDVATATFHFGALLDKRPNHYEALARLIELLKRAGRVSEAGRYLKQALRAVPSAETSDVGYRYCKGLLHRYSNEPADAIKCFNTVRLSGAWGVRATEHMVRIYLSPDNDPLWSNAREADSSSGGKDGLMEALQVADRLLADIPPATRTRLHKVMACQILVATRVKAQVETAVEQLTALLETDADYPPALLTMAAAYMVQEQSPKARNLAKRLLKLPHDSELLDDFAAAHLLLADVHIEAGKYDQASEELKAALQLDASCARAYEYLGAIAEREVRYAEASDAYERAWRLESEASAPVGYKLAFNYLKAGRYVPAMDVAHRILKRYPDYPRLRTEVLEKARSLIRG